MNFFKKYIGDLFITRRFYIGVFAIIILYVASYFVPELSEIANIALALYLALLLIEYFFLFFLVKRPIAERKVQDRLSNGDENKVTLYIRNLNRIPVNMQVYDELPPQLQERNFSLFAKFSGIQQKKLEYKVRPVKRGQYNFGNIMIYLQSKMGLLQRRYEIVAEKNVRVYPSFMALRHEGIVSASTMTQGDSQRRQRRMGQSMEFEQIKDYVIGDDIRNINWKASARRSGLMVNHYTDEKAQQVYCIIDKGRLMKMPFNKMSLLDYAINSTLALCNICLQKQDKFGLISFGERKVNFVAADKSPLQRDNVMEALYKENTGFSESDFEQLYMQVRHKLKQRSLLIMFTNFESLNGMKRQLNYLRSIARHHLLLVVFFENEDLAKLSTAHADDIDDVYVKTIAEKFVYEKKQIVKELKNHGIMSLLTPPQNLTTNAINKYLEIKDRRLL